MFRLWLAPKAIILFYGGTVQKRAKLFVCMGRGESSWREDNACNHNYQEKMRVRKTASAARQSWKELYTNEVKKIELKEVSSREALWIHIVTFVKRYKTNYFWPPFPQKYLYMYMHFFTRIVCYYLKNFIFPPLPNLRMKNLRFATTYRVCEHKLSVKHPYIYLNTITVCQSFCKVISFLTLSLNSIFVLFPRHLCTNTQCLESRERNFLLIIPLLMQIYLRQSI